MDKKYSQVVHTFFEKTAPEYKAIKQDLVHVILINGVFLALILGLYFWNLQSHVLQKAFSQYLHL